jgi:hypothetical protein
LKKLIYTPKTSLFFVFHKNIGQFMSGNTFFEKNKGFIIPPGCYWTKRFGAKKGAALSH